MKASEFDRNEVLKHAQICALWSTTAPEEDGSMGENLDENYEIEDFSEEAVSELVSRIDQFFDMAEQAGNLLDSYPGDAAQMGHDIVLTMNRHGAGFWDRGYGELGDKLTEICHSLGGYELYVGDDGKIYV